MTALGRSTVGRIEARRARSAARRRQHSTIVMLVRHLDGSGGVCRSATNLANGFAEAGFDVTMLVLLRRWKDPRYPLDDRVKVRYVRSLRKTYKPRQQEYDDQPSELCEGGEGMSALTDRLLRRQLRRLEPCTLISHRPALHQAAARWAPEGVLRLAVEHTAFDLRNEATREALKESLKGTGRDGGAGLDRMVMLTEENRRLWAEELGSDERLATIPNGVPFSLGGVLGSWDAPVLVSAGSLIERKGYDRLIPAFAPLVEEFPDWRLRIFGNGRDQEKLEELVAELGVGHAVDLAGYTRELDAEMRASSAFVMSSRSEGLPMVVLEAMAMGLPVVAFDVEGPRQLVEHGRTGLLVPDDDLPAMTEALRRVMSDADLRRRYGQAGATAARGYHAGNVVEQWRELIGDVTG